MKHFETKFASTDFKVNLLNLKKIFLEKNRFFKKLIRNFNLPINSITLGNSSFFPNSISSINSGLLLSLFNMRFVELLTVKEVEVELLFTETIL